METRTVGDEIIVLDVTGHRVHRLNSSASYIWQCCDGQTSAEDMAARLAATHSLRSDDVLKDVEKTLAEFDRLGLTVTEAS